MMVLLVLQRLVEQFFLCCESVVWLFQIRFLWNKESLREVARKDAQLVDDRVQLLDALTKLTERNEQLITQQQKLQEKYEGEQCMESAMIAALEKQNGLLRQIVQEREDEISDLEHTIAGMKATGSGDDFTTPLSSYIYFMIVVSASFTVQSYTSTVCATLLQYGLFTALMSSVWAQSFY